MNQRGMTQTSSNGVLSELTKRIKLICQLMVDRRVNPLIKLLPLASLAMVFIPDLPGPIDDAVVLWLGTTLFVELCPDEVVQEYVRGQQGTPVSAKDAAGDDVIDVEIKG